MVYDFQYLLFYCFHFVMHLDVSNLLALLTFHTQYVLTSSCRYVMLLSHKDIYQYETQRAGLVHMPIMEISGCPTMMCPISEGRYVPCKFRGFCSGVIKGCGTAVLHEWLWHCSVA